MQEDIVIRSNSKFKSWFRNGRLHREDGPAIEYTDGRKEWYLYGKMLTQRQHAIAVNGLSLDGKEIVIDGITYILMEKTNAG